MKEIYAQKISNKTKKEKKGRNVCRLDRVSVGKRMRCGMKKKRFQNVWCGRWKKAGGVAIDWENLKGKIEVGKKIMFMYERVVVPALKGSFFLSFAKISTRDHGV